MGCKGMNHERDQGLLQLRPSLPIETGLQQAIEQFQSETLRPVLKFQNPLILSLFRVYVRQTKANLAQMSAQQRSDYIFNALGKDIALKNMLIGAVIGLFTEAELAFYDQHRPELTRRLTQFLAKRIDNQWLVGDQPVNQMSSPQ